MDIFPSTPPAGTPVRLTTNSGSETPIAFLNDHEILFRPQACPPRESSRAPFLNQTWKLDISERGLRPQLFLSHFRWELQACRNQAKCSIRTRRVSRTYGASTNVLPALPTPYGSTTTADLTQLTKFNGHDLNPVWKADGNSFFFISEGRRHSQCV